MATEATPQVVPFSVDRQGVSVATSSRSAGSPRAGSVYDPVHLAAADPVWFHPMPDGGHLAILSRRLRDAQPGPVGPDGVILSTSAVTDDEPCWVRIHPATGSRGDVRAVPSRQPGRRVLTAATSRGDFIFVLNRHSADGPSPVTTTGALLQNFRVTARGNIVLEDEEFVPGGLALGLWTDRSHVWVFGDDGSGRLALARKNWGRIGTNSDPNADRLWQFRGRDGWHSEISMMVPIPGPLDGVPADGPCSVARLRDRYYLAATERVRGDAVDSWRARIYTTRRVDEGWTEAGSDTVPLGDQDSYLGGGLRLQSQLALSPGFSSIVTSGGLTVLRPEDHHVQVFTGSAPQTVVLPARAKRLGTVVNTDGSLVVPEDDLPVLSPSSASATRGEDGSLLVTFTVTASRPPDSDVSAAYAVTTGDVTDPVVVGIVVVPGGSATRQVVVLAPAGSSAAPGPFTVELSDPIGALVTAAGAGGDSADGTIGDPSLDDGGGSHAVPPPGRIEYMPHTIHNHSTADVTVLAADRSTSLRVRVPPATGYSFTPYAAEPTRLTNWSWAPSTDRSPRPRTGFPFVWTVGFGDEAEDGGTTLRTRWSVYDPTAPATPGAPPGAQPVTAPGPEPADSGLLRELIRRFTILANSVVGGVLSVSAGLVDTVNSLVLGAVGAMTGDPPGDPDGSVRALTVELLQGLARGGDESAAAAFEAAIRQATGGTGLTGGVIQGTPIATAADFIQQVVEAGIDLVEEVVEGISEIFAQIINAITGFLSPGV